MDLGMKMIMHKNVTQIYFHRSKTSEKDYFLIFNKNNTEFLTPNDILAGCQEQFAGTDLLVFAISIVFIDKEKSKQFSKEKFQAFWDHLQKLLKDKDKAQQIDLIFAALDRDSKGLIEVSSLKEIYEYINKEFDIAAAEAALGKTLTKEQLADILEMNDQITKLGTKDDKKVDKKPKTASKPKAEQSGDAPKPADAGTEATPKPQDGQAAEASKEQTPVKKAKKEVKK